MEDIRKTILIIAGDKGVYAFPKSINPKVNVIAWLEFELAYYDVTVQHFNHYTTGNPLDITIIITVGVDDIIAINCKSILIKVKKYSSTSSRQFSDISWKIVPIPK